MSGDWLKHPHMPHPRVEDCDSQHQSSALVWLTLAQHLLGINAIQ